MVDIESGEASGKDPLLELGLFDFRDPVGPDISARCEPFGAWVEESSRAGYFQFLRHHESAPATRSTVIGWGGQRYEGLNFASQDYLGLSRHPDVIRAAADACLAYGTHSAGSEPMGGGLAAARALERDLGRFVEHQHVVLFPTGWAAGYGAIKALVRPYDFIVLDALAHDCLQHGARASTPNIALFAHNDLGSLRKRLQKIRGQNEAAAILVVTESLFSMDSDHADMRAFIEICKDFRAASLVDVAHDLGAIGPGGKGTLAEYGVLPDVDFLIGSFSKTFACIGGFFASHSKGPAYYVRGFSGSYTFSNYLIPPQVAAIRTAFAIATSPPTVVGGGDELRRKTLESAELLRRLLADGGLEVLGRTSPLVLPHIGAERIARRAYKSCLEQGLILNNIEFPACRRGSARFRLQLTPAHSSNDLTSAAEIVIRAIDEARRHA
jgi:7-keto-8-aminopelargonate synthetase-like enzyme